MVEEIKIINFKVVKLGYNKDLIIIDIKVTVKVTEEVELEISLVNKFVIKHSNLRVSTYIIMESVIINQNFRNYN